MWHERISNVVCTRRINEVPSLSEIIVCKHLLVVQSQAGQAGWSQISYVQMHVEKPMV